MRTPVLILVLILLASCTIRPKQWVGAGLIVSTIPVNYTVESQPVRIGATFALLAATVALMESDARRDRTGERVTLVYYDRASNPPQIYHYIQEVCSSNILVCMGPNQTYSVRAVKRLKGKRPRYLISGVIVAGVPRGTELSVVHRIVAHGQAEVDVLGVW